MQIGMNYAVAKLKNGIINLISECELPPTVVSIIMGEIKGDVDVQANLAISKEEKEAKESEQDGEKIRKA